MFAPTRRLVLTSLAAAATLAITGCAGPFTVSADVSSYGSWPAGRKPGTFAFDRLPSQQQNEEATKRQTALEDAARVALEKAGFQPATDAKSADILVTLGARVTAYDPVPWDDPLWWRLRGRLLSPRYGYVGAGPWGWRQDPFFDRRYDRAVGRAAARPRQRRGLVRDACQQRRYLFRRRRTDAAVQRRAGRVSRRQSEIAPRVGAGRPLAGRRRSACP